jgi:PD-(D/E)XK nuclease superfamily
MHSLDEFLNDTISPLGVHNTDSIPVHTDGTDEDVQPSFQEPGYEGSTDYRIRQLSYSSLLTLHSCPRKFQLYRLRTTHRTEESSKSTVTFAFGHVVGEGIQQILEGLSESQVIWNMFLGWHTDLYAEDPKLAKGFFQAVIAIKRFISLRQAGFLKEYELVYYNGKPACELSFSVTFPDGYRLRGFVDAVLRHKDSGKVIVLECKTTGSATINPATYKNSAQAIGYSIVLDVIFPELSSYEVLYLVYGTKSGEYLPIPFQKTYLQRALWIRELLLDIETIKMYEEAEVYPMHGESCYSFFRECEYLNVCQLSTGYLTKPCTPDQEDKTEYQINLTLDDLLTTQLAKAEMEE